MSSAAFIRPAESQFEAWYQDGITPLRQPAAVLLGDSSLTVVRDGAVDLVWPYGRLELHSSPHHGEPVRLGPRGGADAIVVEDPLFFGAWRQRFPGESRWYEITPEWERWPAVVLAMAAIAAVSATLYFHALPVAADLGARFAPRSIETRLGDAVTNILAPQKDHCGNADARLLLGRISGRLAAALPKEADGGYRFQVTYTNSYIPNAFAAPGGKVVVFQGLLREMETPEELAGVLAHEFQHVVHRHSMRALAREVSGRTLLSLLSFDSSGTAYGIASAANLMNLHYQRGDEQQADDEGVKLLTRAGIRPEGLGRLLRRLRARDGIPEVGEYWSTHPATVERAQRLEEMAAKLQGTYSDLMTADEWNKARNVCPEK
jgi:predicted Zn-dependent protease